MKNSKTLMIVVITLIAVNCLLIGTLWYNNYRRKMPMPAGGAFEYLTKELKLTPAQVKQYEVLRNQHFNFTSKLNQEIRLERDSFFDKLSDPFANAAAVNQIEQRILTRQQMQDTATFNHFRKLRAILTTGQQSKFDAIIKNALGMMAGPHGPEGQHPGQPPAGPQGVQDGSTQGPPPNGIPMRPRPDFGQGGPEGPPPQGPPPPDGPPQ